MIPPQHIIDVAVETANESPCAKSKRGVVLFRPGNIIATGFNGPPNDLPCLRTEACKERCSHYCVHAEQRAINDSGDILGNWDEIEALHVHTVDGQLVPGGGPSCLPCANAVLDNHIEAFWLYEVGEPPRWRRYTAEEFYEVTVIRVGLWKEER